MEKSAHIMISIYAEAVAKQALLAHYMDGHHEEYHHKEMLEQLQKLMKELERNGLLAKLTDVEVA